MLQLWCDLSIFQQVYCLAATFKFSFVHNEIKNTMCQFGFCFYPLWALALCWWRARVFGRGGGWKQVVGVTMTTSSEILIEMLVC
jgi:hypothetical protein